jgi:hypothetical protein
MVEKKSVSPPPEAPLAPELYKHVNVPSGPAVGPKSGAPLADWRKDRDYENFMPISPL